MQNELIRTIMGKYEEDPGMLIPMLQDIQAACGFLPEKELRGLSSALDIPLTRVYGVATFYASFRMTPKGKHDVTLCMGTVCFLKGSKRIAETICDEYKILPGGTTADSLFTFQTVNCVGACALAPVMIIDGTYYNGVTPRSALKLINALPNEREVAQEEPKQ